MSKAFLLVDFGASRIKSAIYKNGEILNIKSYPSIMPSVIEDKKFEVSVQELKNIFIKIAESEFVNLKYDAVLICSEMHGFILTDKDNKPLTEYISWKDERCLNMGEINHYNNLKASLSSLFLKHTGMHFRSCYPVAKVNSVANDKNINEFKIISLPEWFCCASDDSLNIAHISMSAGLGFYNIENKSWDKDILSLFKNLKISFNNVTDDIVTGGYIHINNSRIPIYTGIGDLQAAILGASYGKGIVNINLGTGSQVATVDLEIDSAIRPFIDGHKLNVITHIPSGRALNIFINFLKSINSDVDYWQIINNLYLDDIVNAPLVINLAVFNSAWGYTDNSGFILNITENNLNLKTFLASLIKGYLKQYEKAIEELIGNNPFNKIILSGGVGKIPVIKTYFEYKYPECEVELLKAEYDETILGLSKIAEKLR